MLTAHGVCRSTMLPEAQHARGLQRGDGVFPGRRTFGEPNRPRHQKIKSEPLVNLKTSGPERDVIQPCPCDISTLSFIPRSEIQFNENMENDDDLASTSYSSSIPNDTIIQAHKHPLTHPSDAEMLQRMSSPIQPTMSIPPPAFIPPPPTSPKKNPTDPNPGRPHVSFEKKVPPSTVSPPEPRNLTEVHESPPRIELTTGDQHTAEDSAPDAKWERIYLLRNSNWVLRSKILELRFVLRQKQLAKSTADDKLLQRFSMEKFGISSRESNYDQREKSIEQLMKDCRDARGEYGPIEDDCIHLEDQLSDQEFELTRLELQFYGQQKGSTTIQEDQVSPALPDEPPAPDTAPEADDFPQEHPLVVSFLSRLGDLDLLQERLRELEEEKELLEDEKDSRLRFGLFLDPADQTWLEKSQTLVDEVLEMIREAKEDVERLKHDCLSRGLIDDSGEPTDFQSQEQSTFTDEEDMYSTSQKSEYVKHPKLLPHPIQSGDLGKGSDEKSDSLGRRISHWMLSQLRMSALDVNLLERTFEEEYGETDDRWEGAVLAVWYEDETTSATEDRAYSYTSTLSMMTHAAPKFEESSTSGPSRYKTYGDQSYHLLLAPIIRLPPSLDHSDAIAKEHTLPSLPKNKVHWHSE